MLLSWWESRLLASELATEIAFDEASRRGVDLIVLHAWSDMPILELPGLEFSALLSEEERSLSESLAGRADTLSRRDGAPRDRMRSTCARDHRKVRIRTACRCWQSRPRWSQPHDAGLGQQHSRARSQNAGDRRPAVMSLTLTGHEERWLSTRTAQ